MFSTSSCAHHDYQGGSNHRRPKASSSAAATAQSGDGTSAAAAAAVPITPLLNARTLRLDDPRLQRGPALSLNPAWNDSPALILGPLLSGLSVGPPKLSAAEASAAAAAEAAQAAGASAVYGLGGAPVSSSSSSGAANKTSTGGGGGQGSNRAQRNNAAPSKALFYKDAVYGDVENAIFHYRQANSVYSASSSATPPETAARHHLPLHVGNALGSARLRVLRAERLRALVLPFDNTGLHLNAPILPDSYGGQNGGSKGKVLPTTTTPPPTLKLAASSGSGGGAAGRSNHSLPPWLLARLPANGLPEWAWAALGEAERDVEVAVASIEDLLYAVNSRSNDEKEKAAWGSLQAELGVARRLRSTGKKASEHIETALQVGLG